jgi:hypothetical protein
VSVFLDLLAGVADDRDSGLIKLTTTLVHASGEWVSNGKPLPILSREASATLRGPPVKSLFDEARGISGKQLKKTAPTGARVPVKKTAPAGGRLRPWGFSLMHVPIRQEPARPDKSSNRGLFRVVGRNNFQNVGLFYWLPVQVAPRVAGPCSARARPH